MNEMLKSARPIDNLPLSKADFLRPGRVALVVWDMQQGLGGRAVGVEAIKAATLRLIAAADARGIPVIWSKHVLPPLEMTTGPFLLFLMKKQKVDHPSKLSPTMRPGMEESEYLPGLAPGPGHLVIEKSQPSFFVDTPLSLRLRALGVDTIIMTGVATDIGVEFTCRHAAALGFYSVVVEDATGAYSREAHERSLTFLRNWTTPVVKAEEVVKAWA